LTHHLDSSYSGLRCWWRQVPAPPRGHEAGVTRKDSLMPTPPPPGSGTSTPKPDDDCMELMAQAYSAGFDDGYEYMLRLCRRFHKTWFKKGSTPPISRKRRHTRKTK